MGSLVQIKSAFLRPRQVSAIHARNLCDSAARFRQLQKMLTRQESTTPSVLKTGMLLKEGTSPPWNWHSRHFILEDSCLKCAAGPLHD